MSKTSKKKPATPKRPSREKSAAKATPKAIKAKAPKPRAAAVRDAIDAKPGTLLTVTHRELTPSALNPRKSFDSDKTLEKIAEIGASIVEKGLLQPLLARPGKKPGAYEIVIGETRWRAIGGEIKAKTLPSDFPIRVIVKDITDNEAVEIGLVENMQRHALSALEEARGFAAMRRTGDTTDRIAAKLGLAKRTVQSRLTLVDRCAPQVLKALEAGEINGTQARTLAMASHKKQRELLDWIDGDVTEEELLRAVTADMPGTHLAYFPLERYTGEIVTEDGTDRKFFADEAMYRKLQEEAIQEKKAEWEAKGVKVVMIRRDKGEYFSTYNWERKPKDKKAVTIMEIGHGLDVKAHTGMVEKKMSRASIMGADQEDDDDQLDLEDKVREKGGAPGADTETPSKVFPASHRLHANRRKTFALQDAIAKDPTMAMRLMCARMLDDYGFNFVLLRKDQNPEGWRKPLPLSPALRSAFEPLLETMPEEVRANFFGENVSEHGGRDVTDLDTSEMSAAIWAALIAMDGEEIDELFAAMVASVTGVWGDSIGCDDAAVEVAKSLGLAGNEAAHGLDLQEDDLAGIQKAGLHNLVVRLGHGDQVYASDKVSAMSHIVIREISAGNAKQTVLPTLQFLSFDDTAAALTNFMAGR